ncbi:hypothetical protein CXP39_02765 [Mesoplasma syrphidae]|uniref:Lipoprotein n=1 Tax=Mesoplasma syrphidae TaxID=225999 RepID=A0A2K9BKE5_9MOLU|nr:lipoprotein [Mesoplasma syrphidae]AUF83706.1 hypothetical protein CXP39_02765 [Mesoplasma syrphidae]
MKKLLTILGAVTLTATAGLSVVACGTTEPKVPPSVAEVVKEYENELNKIWSGVYNANAHKFVRQIGEGGDKENYQLFNLNYLESEYGNRKEGSFNLHDDQKNIEMFSNDLSKLFPKEQFESMIQDNIATGENAIKYRNIYMGSPQSTLGEFKISTDKGFVLTKTAYVEGEKNEKLYSIQSTITKDMYHKDSEGQKVLFQTMEIPMNIIIGKDGPTISLIEKIVSNLPKRLFSEKGSQFASSIIKQTDSAFKTYDDELQLKLANYINSEVFKNTIDKEVADLNNNESIYKLEFGTKISEESQVAMTSTMLRNDNKRAVQTKRMFDLQRNPLANSLILKKADTKVLEEKDASMMLQEIIKDLDKSVSLHDQDLTNFLGLYVQDQKAKEKMIQQTHSFGNFRLNNINLEMNNSGKTIELPTMVIPWTYRNDKYNDLNKKDLWLNSLYNSLKVINEKVMATRADYYNNKENEEVVEKGMFAVSEKTLSEIRNSFSIEWSEILERTEKDRNSSFSENVYTPKMPKIFKVRDNVTWVDLARSGKNYITDESSFDFSSFSAKIETVLGIDKNLGNVGSHASGATLESQGSKYSKNPIKNNKAFYRVGDSQSYSNVSSSYIFNIGLINFRMYLPLDLGKAFDTLSATKNDNWDGKQYFDLSNDKSLFTKTEADFDWNAVNPYAVLESSSWLNSILPVLFQLR